MLSKIPPFPVVLLGYCLYLPSIHPLCPFRNAFNTVSPVSLEIGLTCLICNLLPCNFVRPHPAHITHAALSGRWTIVMSLPKKTRALQTNEIQTNGNAHIHQDVSDKVVQDLNSMFHLLLGSCLKTNSCGSQALSKEVLPSDLSTTHILSYLSSFCSLLSLPRPKCPPVLLISCYFLLHCSLPPHQNPIFVCNYVKHSCSSQNTKMKLVLPHITGKKVA